MPEDETTPNLPKEYSIHITPGEVHNKFVFSEDQNGGKAISGTVHHECTATPSQFGAYRSIMRKRVLEAGTPQRSVQVLGQNSQPVFVPGASSGMPSSSFSDFIVIFLGYIKLMIMQKTHKYNFLDNQKAQNRQRKSNPYAQKRTHGFAFHCIRQIPLLVI